MIILHFFYYSPSSGRFIGPFEAHSRKKLQFEQGPYSVNNSMNPLSSNEKSKLNLNIDIGDPNMLCQQRSICVSPEITLISMESEYSKNVLSCKQSNGSLPEKNGLNSLDSVQIGLDLNVDSIENEKSFPINASEAVPTGFSCLNGSDTNQALPKPVPVTSNKSTNNDVISDEPLLEVKYIKPKIFFDPVSQNVFRKGKIYGNTIHFICKQIKCKGTSKLLHGKLIHLRNHTSHECSTEEFLLNQRVKSAVYYTSIFKKMLGPTNIYEEVTSLFPLFKTSSKTKRRMLAQIRKWKKEKSETITEIEYSSVMEDLQQENQKFILSKCKWCLNRNSSYVVFPCGHLCLCFECQKNFEPNAKLLHYTVCPLCDEMLLEEPKKVIF